MARSGRRAPPPPGRPAHRSRLIEQPRRDTGYIGIRGVYRQLALPQLHQTEYPGRGTHAFRRRRFARSPYGRGLPGDQRGRARRSRRCQPCGQRCSPHISGLAGPAPRNFTKPGAGGACPLRDIGGSALALRSPGAWLAVSSVRLQVDGSRAPPRGAVLKSGTRAAADSSSKSWTGWGLLLRRNRPIIGGAPTSIKVGLCTGGPSRWWVCSIPI